MQRYINLFVASELVSDVLGLIPASSPCGLWSKAGGRTEVLTAEGAEYAESENQYSFVVKQFCISTGVLVPDPFSFFAHPAYVMQGVSDRDAVFAMPLDGIEELEFYPVVDRVDLDDVTWSVRVSHPEGIRASIEGKTLYIWGSNASWAGYGEVTLEAAVGTAVSSVIIPVTVFRDDKTLINAEGKKDYFVPWAPELDVNRILSVEEHMRTYDKDEGNLDRSIQWSRWKKMEYRRDVDFITLWFNSSIPWAQGWTESAQFALVDVYLDELQRFGVDGIRLRDIYYFMGLAGSELVPIYDRAWFGVTRRPRETAYIVNEAHRQGISVVLGNAFFPHVATQAYELFNANPTPRADFFANVAEKDRTSLPEWSELGVDIVDLGTQIETINEATHTWAEARYIDEQLSQMADDARDIYPGPLYHAALPFGKFYPGKSQLEAEFWEHFDILGSGVMALRVTAYSDPTLEELIDGWRKLIHDYHQPFQERYNKPLLAYENGCPSVKGCVNWGGYGGDCFAADVSSKPFSLSDTRLWYISQDKAFNEMEGYFGPGWHLYAFDPFAVGSIRDRSTNPRLKVEDVIQTLFLGEVTPYLIQIDGSISDWSDKYVIGLDPIEDSCGQNDLKELSFTQDDMYLYFRVDYTSPPSGDLRIEIDVDGDLKADLHLDLTNQYSPDGTWWGNSFIYSSSQLRIGFVDSIDAGRSLELRVPKRFLQGILNEQYLGVRLRHYDRFWDLGDETQWVTLWGKPLVPSSSVFELLDCGLLTADTSLALEGQHSILGEYWEDGNFTPYLRTAATLLPLSPEGRYRVSFDYRIIETSADGFEVLFLSPTGAREANWVQPLRLHGTDGQSGRGFLEAQLHDYSDYEIRWNVVSTGKIVIDNVVVRDLATDQIIAEEDFEDWR